MRKDNLKQPSALKFSDTCVSCSGQVNFLQKALKLACLSYKPSKILFEDQVYSRKELLEKREENLSHQQKIIY